MAKRWTKAFAILLGVAIPTGTIVGVQISLLWPGFAKIVGQVISVPFQIEIFAFFWRLYSCRFTYMQLINFLHL